MNLSSALVLTFAVIKGFFRHVYGYFTSSSNRDARQGFNGVLSTFAISSNIHILTQIPRNIRITFLFTTIAVSLDIYMM